MTNKAKKVNIKAGGLEEKGKTNTINGASGCQKKGNTILSSSRVNPCKNWVFTLNNYTEENITELLTHKKISGAKKYMFQREIGESGTPHLQGFIVFSTKIRPLSLKLCKKIHWEKMKGTVLDNIKYCSKSETKNGCCYYKGCKPFKEVITIQKEQFYEWETDLLNIIQNDDSDRTIHWIWENTGGVGKSSFAKWLGVHEQAVICSGKAADMKFMISSRQLAGNPTDLIIFDVPRCKVNRICYDGMEEIKNGFFCSSKYESSMTIMNSPTILVFANEEPKYEMISADRWKVYNILDNKLIHRSGTDENENHHLPPAEAESQYLLPAASLLGGGRSPPRTSPLTGETPEPPMAVNKCYTECEINNALKPEYKISPDLMNEITYGTGPARSCIDSGKGPIHLYFN